MTDWARSGFSRLGFRALLSSVVVADLWLAHQPSSELALPEAMADSSLVWQPVYLAVAQACAAGQPIRGEPWAELFQTVAQASLQGALLVATPVLLLKANRYGHHQDWTRRWANYLALPATVQLALGHYYQQLCENLARQRVIGSAKILGLTASDPSHPDRLSLKALHSASEVDPLGPLPDLVQAAQGQFLLTLELAQALGWPEAAISLAGLWAILVTGPAGLPGALYHRYLESPVWPQRWPHCDGLGLRQLADEVYSRWAGVGREAVLHWGTAYNG